MTGTPLVKTCGRTLGSAVGSRGDKSLSLDEERTYTFYCTRDCYARQSIVVLGEQQLRGIAYLTETILLHLINAKFGGASESVLYTPENSVHIVLVTLELDDGIYDML
jgi:hypothetical protein